MPVPPDFNFSQGSLQDYLDCPRRFELRYIQHLQWPAVQSEPVEEAEFAMQMGQAFHRLAHQYFLGIPPQRLTPAPGSQLARWWESFLETVPPLVKGTPHPEIALRTPFAGYSLLAQYDCIFTAPGRLVIFDWKTNKQPTRRAWLLERMQTRLYPYLLVKAGKAWNRGEEIHPAQVEMIYWFTADPHHPEHFPYSAAQYQQDETDLQALVERILATPDGSFTLTAELRRCLYCPYRSYCERGVQAGAFTGEEEEENAVPQISLDFEHISEVEF